MFVLTEKQSMIRTATVAMTLGLFLLTASSAHAATMSLIDWSDAESVEDEFPSGEDDNGNHWNTVGDSGKTFDNPPVTDLVSSSDGTDTGWDLDVDGIGEGPDGDDGDAGFGGTAINGNQGPEPFDQEFAVNDGIFSQDDDFSVVTFTFSGLLASTQYDFSAIGGRTDGNGVDGVIEVVTGAGSGGGAYTLENDGTVLDFSIVSDASGEAAFTFHSSNADKTGSESSTFNALSVTEIPEPASLALMGLGGLALLSRRRQQA